MHFRSSFFGRLHGGDDLLRRGDANINRNQPEFHSSLYFMCLDLEINIRRSRDSAVLVGTRMTIFGDAARYYSEYFRNVPASEKIGPTQYCQVNNASSIV